MGCGEERLTGKLVLRGGSLSLNQKEAMSERYKDLQVELSRQREQPPQRPLGGPGY